MAEMIYKEKLAVKNRYWRFAPGLRIEDYMKPSKLKGIAAEFIGSDDFNRAFFERQRFEVDSGRDEEPILYDQIYSIINDPNLPGNVEVHRLGPGGVIFNAINEGGEVKFATVGESTFTVPILQYGVGLEYSKRLAMFNETWNVAIVERQVGRAFNALLNHIHFNPILTHSYGSSNQTAAATEGTTLPEKYLRTLEAAANNGAADNSNRREGPYALMVSVGDRFTVERALNRVPQEGITLQSSVIDLVPVVVAYNGWTGTRGKKSTTYPGVTSGKAYLVNLAFREEDFQSYVKQDLLEETGNPDVSRFVLEQTVWDTWFGAYADPGRAVQEITWPSS